MNEHSKIPGRISSHCSGFINKRYARWKLQTDPLYQGVHAELVGSALPLLDIGCGMGILGMYLRERGWNNRIEGFDFDSSKISAGREMVAKGGYPDIFLEQGDVRKGLPDHSGDVTILDILQYFSPEEREAVLISAASQLPAGGRLIIRSGLAGESLRFRITWIVDMFSKAAHWMKSAPVGYPSADFFVRVLEAEGLEVTICPFWGKTPFHNFMILAVRPEG